MVRENITALLLLYIRPVAAISRILESGTAWFAIVVAILVSLALHTSDVGALAMAGTRANLTNSLVREQAQKTSKEGAA